MSKEQKEIKSKTHNFTIELHKKNKIEWGLKIGKNNTQKEQEDLLTSIVQRSLEELAAFINKEL